MDRLRGWWWWASIVALLALLLPRHAHAQCTGNQFSAGAGVSAVTYGGQPLTLHGAASRASVRSEIWYLKAPPTGSNTVAITAPGGTYASLYAASAASFSGVDQTTPLGSLFTATGTGTSPTVTVNSASGEGVLDIVGTVGSTVPAADASQQSLQTAHNGTSVSLGMSEKPGAASVAMSWTIPSGAWAEAAVAIKASASQTRTGVFDFTGVRDGRAVRLGWEDAYDPRSVGFYVHRQDGVGGPRERVSPEMIPSGPTLVGARAFAWTDETVSPGEMFYWLEDVNVDGGSTWTGPLRLLPESAGIGDSHFPGDSPSTATAATAPPNSGPSWSCALRQHRPLVLGVVELPFGIVLILAVRRRSRANVAASLAGAALVAIATALTSPAAAAGGVAMDSTTASGTASFSHTVSTNPNALLLVTVVTPAVCVDDVTSWNLATPGAASNSGGHSATNAPTITGNVATDGNVVKLYTDSSCTTQYGGNTTVASNTFSISGTVPGTDGVKAFYYTIADASGNTKACTATGLSYTYQARPIYTLSRTFYTYKQSDGNALGPNDLLTVTRDEAGIADTVTLTPYAVSATTGYYTTTPVTVTFASTVTSATAAGTNPLGVTAFPAAFNADLFFTIKMTTTASGTTSAASVTQAQVNILEGGSGSPGNYFFGNPLVTAIDTAGSASLTLQRKTAGTAESVTVDFMDGTAIAPAAYTSTQLTATFGAADTEIAVSVPIADVASNRSFYARINPTSSVPASGVNVVRRQSLCKIRILDAAEDTSSSVCDSSITTAFGGGTGADATHPYTICNTSQLNRVRTAMTGKYFKMMADVDATGMAPIDTATAPAALGTYFDGFFDGNERTVSNFTYVGSGADQSSGLFRAIGTTTTNTAYLKNLNVNFASVSGVGSVAGLVAGANGRSAARAAVNVDSVFANGYVASNVNAAGLVFGFEDLRYAVDQTVSLTHAMSAGTVTIAGSDYAGGIFGYLGTASAGSYSITMNGLYSASAVSGAAETGGIAGYMNLGLGASTAVAASIQNVYTRGLVAGTGYVGGLVGDMYMPIDVNLDASTNLNNAAKIVATNDGGGLYGNMTLRLNHATEQVISGSNCGAVQTSASCAGGIIGRLVTAGGGGMPTTNIHLATNTGAISAGAGYAGGMVGHTVMQAQDYLYLRNDTNSGAVAATGNYVGGMMGDMSTTAASIILELTNNTNSGAVSATLGYVGGMLGYFSVLDDTDALNLSGDSNSGSVSGTQDVGGLLGYVDIGTISVSAPANTNSGTITGTSAYVGGAIGYLDGRYVDVSAITNTGSVTGGGNSVGGIVGTVQVMDGWSVYLSSLDSHTGTIMGTNTGSSVGGIVGRILSANVASPAGSSFTMNDCKSRSPVSSANTSGANGTGGLIGTLSVAGVSSNSSTVHSVYNSWASGDVDTGTTGIYAGGLIGNIYNVPAASMSATGTVDIWDVYATGAVTGKSYLGGLIGYAITSLTRSTGAITVSNAYATGAITANGAGTYIGGLVGRGNAATSALFDLSSAYTASCVTGASATWKGAVFGTATASSTFSSGFWRLDGGGAGSCNFGLTQSATAASTAAVTDGNSKTQGQLQTAATFSDGIFPPATWSKVNGSYPTLLGMP